MTMMIRTTKLAQAAIRHQTRSISIGTDMKSSVISLQKSRPWYMCAEEGSNKAADNAVVLKDLFAKKTVAFFGVPAPFTGTCSNEHYPGYKALADEFLTRCDKIVCYSVSDPYAMDGWQKALGNDESKISFLSDPDGTFAKAYGLEANYDATSLGDRSIRFSMLVCDGNVVNFRKVEDAATDAETLLEELKEFKENSGDLKSA